MKYFELNNMVTQRGDDGFFRLDKDQEAVQEFLKEVDSKTKAFNSELDRLQWLIDNEYYYDVFEQYTVDQVLEIHDIAYSYGFAFKSFMQVSKFFSSYALKTKDKVYYLENIEQHNSIVALYLANGNFEKAKNNIRMFMEGRYHPATPTYQSAGRAYRGELVSCYLLAMDDSTNSIEYNLSCMAQLSRLGGGVSTDISNLRSFGDPILRFKDAAKGVVGVAKQMEQKFIYYDKLGQRKGAGAAYLNVFHRDVVRFLDTKKINASDNVRLNMLSLGLTIPQKFYDLVKEDKVFYAFSPYYIKKYYGLRMTEVDFDEMYDIFLEDDRIVKKEMMNARDFLTRIGQIQAQSGYPYIFNITNANKKHALKGVGTVITSNLCTEIMQLQEISEIKNYGEENGIKRDISCTLGSLNITNVMSTKKLKETVYDAMDTLTFVTDSVNTVNAPGVTLANEELHAVGLGAMDLQGYYALNHIMYESFEARDFARTFFMSMNYYSLEKSMLIAKERNKTFKDFDKSEYASGNYFKKYLINDYSPKTEKVKSLFEGIEIPTIEDWKRLKEDVMKYGLYHAYRLAIAPTQSSSYVQYATSSVQPVVDKIEIRSYDDSKTYYPAPHLTSENQWYYKSAYDINMFKLLDLVAVIQEHVDQGISTVLFINQEATTADVASYIMYANELGLKSLYYSRFKRKNKPGENTSDNECTSCHA